MANQPNTVEHEHEQDAPRIPSTDRNQALKALRRLRTIGEKLPQVDAAAIVREGRALAEDRGAR